MTSLVLVHRSISSSLSFLPFRAVRERAASLITRHAVAGVAAAFIALGVVLYITALLMSFGLGVRLRDSAGAGKRESEDLKRREVLEYQREAGFSQRHRESLAAMQEVTTLRYLTAESASLSEAHATAPVHHE